MKRLLFSVLLLLPLLTAAQEIAGVWEGAIAVGGSRLRLVFRIDCVQERYRATMESPDQGPQRLPVDTVVCRTPQVSLALKRLGVTFRGELTGEGTLAGTFSQSGMDFPLVLTRRAALRRPQTPQPPYPYESREVTFPSRAAGVTLRGTLTLPASGKPAAAVVLVSGSGLQNRDEELFGHKPFLVLADALTRCGIAVLRYDDRGFGTSAAERRRLLADATTDDFMRDALGAFDWLSEATGLDGRHVGIAGHSEGGTIAFMAAAEEPEVGFVVSMAGSMLPGSRVNRFQNRRAMERQHLPAAMVDAGMATLDAVYAALAETPREALAERIPALKRTVAAGPAATLPAPLRDRLLSLFDEAAANAWLYRFLTYDPAATIRRSVARPVLAVNGALDGQVDASEHLGAVRRLLAESEQLTVRCYEGLNHLFQPAATGDSSEYETIETTFAPEVLDDVAEWILGAVCEEAGR